MQLPCGVQKMIFLWSSTIFCSFSLSVLSSRMTYEPWQNIQFRIEYSTASYSVHLDLLWVSVNHHLLLKMSFCVAMFGLVWFFLTEFLWTVSPGCPGTHSVDQTDFKLRDLPASFFWVMGSKACDTMPSLKSFSDED